MGQPFSVRVCPSDRRTAGDLPRGDWARFVLFVVYGDKPQTNILTQMEFRFLKKTKWVSMTFGKLLESAWVNVTSGELLLH